MSDPTPKSRMPKPAPTPPGVMSWMEHIRYVPPQAGLHHEQDPNKLHNPNHSGPLK